MTTPEPVDPETPAPEYVIEGGWLCQVVNEHTCGTAKDGYYGAHEPGCGLIPIADISGLLAKRDRRKQAEVARSFAEWAAKNEIAAPPLDWAWFGEIQRCYNPDHEEYEQDV